MLDPVPIFLEPEDWNSISTIAHEKSTCEAHKPFDRRGMAGEWGFYKYSGIPVKRTPRGQSDGHWDFDLDGIKIDVKCLSQHVPYFAIRPDYWPIDPIVDVLALFRLCSWSIVEFTGWITRDEFIRLHQWRPMRRGEPAMPYVNVADPPLLPPHKLLRGRR